MLTLTIKDNQTIFIGDNIKIVLKKAKGQGTHKVSIEAPKDLVIQRER